MKFDKKLLAGVVLAAIATFSINSTANATDVTLQFANTANQAGKDAAGLLKKLVNEKTNGALDIHLYNDNSFADDRVSAESTILGEIDICNVSTANIANIFPDLYAYDAPFIFNTPDEAFAWFDSEEGKKLNSIVETKGLVLLGVWQNGFRDFTNSKVPVKVPADIKGMKVRTMENEIQLKMWSNWGCNPTPMAYTEVLAALQQGTIDAQENPLALIDSSHFYEAQKYISRTGHVYSPHFVLMNRDSFESLSPDFQKALLDSMVEATAFERKTAVANDETFIEKFTKAGNVVVELTTEEKDQWRKMALEGGVYDLVKSKMDHPEFLDKILSK